MASMTEFMQALSQVTGWKQLNSPDSKGIYQVSLEDDLDVVFFSLGDRLCLMRGVVVNLPDTKEEAQAKCQDALSKQVAVLREHPSFLALEEAGTSGIPGQPPAKEDALICFRSVPLNLDRESFLNEVQDWLNDLAFWKSILASTENLGSEFSSMFNAGQFFTLKP
ncbi:MAG: hypothetical protein IJU40_01085 [Desulfovibrionaceae bacterium]|nr:hypothetical protein [Desulfovibrionaceae bacterium]